MWVEILLHKIEYVCVYITISGPDINDALFLLPATVGKWIGDRKMQITHKEFVCLPIKINIQKSNSYYLYV